MTHEMDPQSIAANTQPPRKRQRATSDPSSTRGRRVRPRNRGHFVEFRPPPDLPRDSEFWFEDGSIVIIAMNVGFRGYKRLLA